MRKFIYLLVFIFLICTPVNANRIDVVGGGGSSGAEVNNLETITTDIAVDEVPVGSAANDVVYRLLPDCDTAATSKLLYDDTTHTFSCGTDQDSGGATAYDAIGDPTGVGSISFDDDETATYITAQNSGTFMTFANNGTPGQTTSMLDITYLQDGSEVEGMYGVYLRARDYMSTTPNTVFQVGVNGNTSMDGTLSVGGKISGTDLLLSGLTASEILGTDASKNIVSLAVATYPSLAELALLKGITANGSSLITAANYAAMRTLLDLESGTDFYTIAAADTAHEAELTNSAGLLAALDDETGTVLAVFNTAPTFETSMTGTYLTANEILITGASKEIISAAVATYPSLAELAYVKGLDQTLKQADGVLFGSVNKVAITAPATSATVTATDGTTTTLSGGTHSGTNTGDNSANSTYTIGSATQAWDAELDTIAALTETNGNVMFVAGGAWTSDATPAIDCTDCTNVPAGSHTGTIEWGGTAILESGVAFQFGDATDATLTHTYGNTGTNVSIAYSTAAMAVTGALTATNLSGTNTGDNDEVGTLTTGDMCTNDGSDVQCTINTLAEITAALDNQAEVMASFTITNGDTAISAAVVDPIACTGRIPNNMKITAWYLDCDKSGDIVIDVWKNTWNDTPIANADSIASSEKPTLSTDVSASDTSLTAMTVDWDAGQEVCIEIESAATVTKCTLNFEGYYD